MCLKSQYSLNVTTASSNYVCRLFQIFVQSCAEKSSE